MLCVYLLVVYSFDDFCGASACRLVGLHQVVEGYALQERLFRHGLRDNFRHLGKPYLAAQKRSYGYLVGSVEHARLVASGSDSVKGVLQQGEFPPVRLFKRESAVTRQ